MSERKAESGSKSVLEIILEFGHKAVLKDEEVKVGSHYNYVKFLLYSHNYHTDI